MNIQETFPKKYLHVIFLIWKGNTFVFYTIYQAYDILEIKNKNFQWMV